jgi:glycosyltransferase involved in cell wall biosynthesis
MTCESLHRLSRDQERANEVHELVGLSASRSPVGMTEFSRTDRAERGRRVGPGFVGVVIPANDESGSIEAAIQSVVHAAAHTAVEGVVVRMVVVDDSSSDSTGDRAAAAAGSTGEVLRVEARSAGAARRAGFLALCSASEGLDADEVWLATTDADTLVFSDWIARQLRWWQKGADGIAGTVIPISWEEQPPVVRRRYESKMAQLGTGFGHPHVYGANLALTKAAYLETGGISAIDSGEDHALWDALEANGRHAIHVPDVRVATSTRREGRAPDGFSALLRSLETNE